MFDLSVFSTGQYDDLTATAAGRSHAVFKRS